MKRNIKRQGPSWKLDPFMSSVFLYAAAAAVIVLASAVSLRLLKNLDFFRVRNVVVRGGGTADRRAVTGLVSGTNIFSVDIAAVSRALAQAHPDCRKVRVMRFPPDSVVIDFLRRKPLARVSVSRLVDENRVIFDAGSFPGAESLPVITGLSRAVIDRSSAGRRCEAPALILALKILESAKANRYLRDVRICRIGVEQAGNASLFFLVAPAAAQYTNEIRQDEMLEAKIGSHDIAGKISILATLLVQVKNNLRSIKYIDLRFREPVIKFKDMEEAR